MKKFLHSLEQRRGCHIKKHLSHPKLWTLVGAGGRKWDLLEYLLISKQCHDYYQDKITACLQRDSLSQIIHDYMPSLLPLSSNTAQTQSWATLVAALEFFPSVYYMFTSTEPEGCSQILGRLKSVSQIQDSSPLSWQVILPTSRFLLVDFIPGFSWF